MPEPLILGNRSMDTVRRPLCGCFVLSCMVGGIFRKPLGFRRCLPPARPEKAKPFQAGQGPFTKHPQRGRLRLHEPKKVFEGSKGRFLKTPPWQGVGQRPTKRIKQKTRPDRLKSQASLSSGFTGKDHSSFSSTTFLAQMISKFPLRQRRSLRKARSSF